MYEGIINERGALTLGAWLAKYWLEVLFGFIVAGIGVFFKYFWKLVKQDREQHDRNLVEQIGKKMDDQHQNIIEIMDQRDVTFKEEDKRIHEEIDELKDDFKIMKGGILSIQGRDFKADCRMLLQPDHIITLSEYESIIEEHEVYKSLGGNHEGDALFTMVQQKYGEQIKSNTNGYK